jgi:hypothetical protein
MDGSSLMQRWPDFPSLRVMGARSGLHRPGEYGPVSTVLAAFGACDRCG